MTDQLGVFAKYWEPGRVKTRLAATLGDQAAAEVHLALLACVLEQLQGAATRCVLCVSPPDRQADFVPLAASLGWTVTTQAEGDLGTRMASYFHEAFEHGMGRVVLVGSDCPMISPRLTNEAFDYLNESVVVLGPSEDGGYYLVGARDSVPPIFDEMEWSTPQVLRRTLDRLSHVGLSSKLLPEGYDIDEAADLLRLRSLLAHEDLSEEPALVRLRDELDRIVG